MLEDLVFWVAALLAVYFSLCRLFTFIFLTPSEPTVPGGPPGPTLWDSIVSCAQFVGHWAPMVVGCGGVVYLAAFAVRRIGKHFDEKNAKLKAERDASNRRIEDIEEKVSLLDSRRYEVAKAVAPLVTRLEELKSRLDAVECRLPEAENSESDEEGDKVSGGEAEAPPPVRESEREGQEVIGRVLGELGRGY